MADVLTVNKALAQQATGSNNDTWGTDLNNTLGTIDTAFGGNTYIVVTGVTTGVYTLTTAQYTPPNIHIAGSLTANVTYLVPAGVGGIWSVYADVFGPSSTLSFASGGGGSVTLTQGYRTLVVSDGTNMQIASQISAASANPSAMVELTSVPGSAVTFMRSDAAPPLDQSIAPTWTGIHQFAQYLQMNAGAFVYGTMEFEPASILNSSAGETIVATPSTGSANNFAASTAFVANTLATSPTLGGNPTTTTQAASNNTTRIATTAFVQAVIAALPVNAGNNTNGSVSIGGLIINYGQLTTPGSSPVTVNYTTAYTTAVYAVVPYLIGANQTYFVSAGFTSSLSHWTLNFGGSAQVVGWIAIGT